LGVKDSDALHTIYEEVKTYCKDNDLPYHFKVDDGDYETAIQFNEVGYSHPPTATSWKGHPVIICPDLLDYKHKLIIEYEEEGQKQLSGARLARKGHGPEGDIPNEKDTRREYYYDLGKFKVLRFYEADLKEENWKKLHRFLEYSKKLNNII